jgi:hypothetical protein
MSMANNILAFDLEIATPFPNDGEWRHKGLGISVATAYHVQDGQGIYETWLPPRIDLGGQDYEWETRIPPQQVAKMVQYLQSQVMKGARLVTWNGVGFDFPFIQEHLGERPLWESVTKALAMQSYDACLQLVCERGFAVGLEAVCRGFGLGAKLDGMHGDLAPEMWTGYVDKARRQELMEITGIEPGTTVAQRRVLEYVMRDAKMTYDAYEQIAAHDGQLRWVNYRGARSRHRFGKRASRDWPLAQARDCLTIAEPDTAWMDEELRERFKRERFTGWLGENE